MLYHEAAGEGKSVVSRLAAGEKKSIRGKLYIVPADVEALLKRYRKDFPEHK